MKRFRLLVADRHRPGGGDRAALHLRRRQHAAARPRPPGRRVGRAQPEDARPTSDTIDQAIAIIRQRVDALGVAEPEITRQGDNILVQIPGVKDKDRALELVGQTAELRFRPVLRGCRPTGERRATDAADRRPTTTDADRRRRRPPPPVDPERHRATTAHDRGRRAERAARRPAPRLAPDDRARHHGRRRSTAPDHVDPAAAGRHPGHRQPARSATGRHELTSRRTRRRAARVRRCDRQRRYQLGPTRSPTRSSGQPASQTAVDRQPHVQGRRRRHRRVQRRRGAVQRRRRRPVPTGQLAIVLDGQVISAPHASTRPSLPAPTRSTISGSFTEDDGQGPGHRAASYGALPVELERSQTQIVSATLGHDALHAGLIAGARRPRPGRRSTWSLFYRLLGLLSIAQARHRGRAALVDHHLPRREQRPGAHPRRRHRHHRVDRRVARLQHRLLRAPARRTSATAAPSARAVDRSFHASFSTILKADGASLIGAALLYCLTVGPVRGFAFFLGLSTVLDLVTSYFFMRPVVRLATQRQALPAPAPDAASGMPEPARSGEPPVARRRPSADRRRPGATTPMSGVSSRLLPRRERLRLPQVVEARADRCRPC